MSLQTRQTIGWLLIFSIGPCAAFLHGQESYRLNGSRTVAPPAPYRIDRGKYRVLVFLKEAEDYCYAPPTATPSPVLSASSP